MLIEKLNSIQKEIEVRKMAKIGNMPTQDPMEADGNSWRNPNSMVRNTLRIRDGEMALYTFLQELLDGDCSFFHTVPEETPNGKIAYPSVYCERNENENGPVVGADCVNCNSTNREVRIRRKKYHYWVYVYSIYHKEQNPAVGQYQDAVEWTLTNVGRRQYFCETLNKPQLLQLSNTMWSSLDNLVSSMENESDMVGQTFRYDHIKDANGRHAYMLVISGMNIDAVNSADIVGMKSALPDLEDVLSGQINEFEFSQFSRGEGGISTADQEAFGRIVENN